jgi:hypothetical protein
MKTMRWSLLVAFSWVTYVCASQAAEEIKYPSSDGRLALRITRPTDDEYHPTVELIEKDSGKVMVTPHNGSDSDLFDASESVLVWSADKAGSVQDSVRVYDITATIGADGKARIDSKLVEKESY